MSQEICKKRIKKLAKDSSRKMQKAAHGSHKKQLTIAIKQNREAGGISHVPTVWTGLIPPPHSGKRAKISHFYFTEFCTFLFRNFALFFSGIFHFFFAKFSTFFSRNFSLFFREIFHFFFAKFFTFFSRNFALFFCAILHFSSSRLCTFLPHFVFSRGLKKPLSTEIWIILFPHVPRK